MQLLGSSIYVTSTFFSMGRFLSTLDSLLLYFYHNSGKMNFQDGMFHKKKVQISDKMRIDISVVSVLY